MPKTSLITSHCAFTGNSGSISSSHRKSPRIEPSSRALHNFKRVKRLPLCHRALHVCATASKPTTTASSRQVVQSVAVPVTPVPEPTKKAGPPLWAIPAVLVTLFGVWRLTARRGSVETLADRGVGLEKDRNVDADKFYKGMMKNVRTTEMPELTPDEIEAARARRRQEQVTRGEEGVESLAEMELPSNHPWAVSEKETEEEKAKREAQVNAQASRRRMRMEPTDNEG